MRQRLPIVQHEHADRGEQLFRLLHQRFGGRCSLFHQRGVLLRHFIHLRHGRIHLVDTGTLSDVEARIATLATDDGHMRRVARELLGLAQYKAGDYAAAQASFEAVINDPLAQSAVRNRMAYYLAQMLSAGTVAPEQPAEAAAEAIDAIVQGDAPADVAAEPPAEPAAE